MYYVAYVKTFYDTLRYFVYCKVNVKFIVKLTVLSLTFKMSSMTLFQNNRIHVWFFTYLSNYIPNTSSIFFNIFMPKNIWKHQETVACVGVTCKIHEGVQNGYGV